MIRNDNMAAAIAARSEEMAAWLQRNTPAISKRKRVRKPRSDA